MDSSENSDFIFNGSLFLEEIAESLGCRASWRNLFGFGNLGPWFFRLGSKRTYRFFDEK